MERKIQNYFEPMFHSTIDRLTSTSVKPKITGVKLPFTSSSSLITDYSTVVDRQHVYDSWDKPALTLNTSFNDSLKLAVPNQVEFGAKIEQIKRKYQERWGEKRVRLASLTHLKHLKTKHSTLPTTRNAKMCLKSKKKSLKPSVSHLKVLNLSKVFLKCL